MRVVTARLRGNGAQAESCPRGVVPDGEPVHTKFTPKKEPNSGRVIA